MRRAFLFVRCAAIGAFLGIWAAFSPGSLFVLVLVCTASTFFYRCVPLMEKKFVVALFVGGFLIRAVLSLGLDASAWVLTHGRPFGVERLGESGITTAFEKTRSFVRMGDSDYYSNRCYGIARYAKGARDAYAVGALEQNYGRNNYLYFTGFFYYLFGFSPVAAKLLNCFWGALTVAAVYFLAKACFNLPIARWSSVAVAVFPSMILWSTTHMKDAFLIAMGVFLLLTFIKLRQSSLPGSTFMWSALLCVALAVHASMRSVVYDLLVVGCFLICAWFSWRMKRIWRLFSCCALLLGAFLLRHKIQLAVAYALVGHLGHVHTKPGIPYHFLPDVFYKQSIEQGFSLIGLNAPFLIAVVKGIFHYLFEPLPGRGGSIMQLLAIPQMAFWYVALPLAFLGMVVHLAGRKRESLFLFLVTGGWTLLGALTNGNVGTVFRMRDMVTPFYLIFAGAGFWFLIRQGQARDFST